MTVRIPLSVALLFLAISTALISLSLHGVSRQFDRQIDDLGQVYLDGLSAAVLPAVRARDNVLVHEVLNRALDTHVGVVDRTLAILSEDGEVLAHVSRDKDVKGIPMETTLGRARSGTRLDGHARGVWVWRELDAAHPELGRVVANLDVGDFMRQRGDLAIELILTGLGISVAGACLGFIVARRMQRPIMLLTQRLRSARGEPPRLLAPDTFPHDPEMEDLLAAYNWMVQGLHEREALASRQARVEREALLGRMSAALAHEVRNPLGGMRTALQTLRQFGHQDDARRESLDFVGRGLEALQAVVDASLRTFRPGDAYQPLRGADLRDVRLMVRAQADRQAVSVHVDSDWPEADAPMLPAAPVRQLLLNLVLNAVAASPRGGAVWVMARARNRALAIHVRDQGVGMPDEAKATLRNAPRAIGERMGLGIVVDLVGGLGGRLRVHGATRDGTCISLWLPYWGANRI